MTQHQFYESGTWRVNAIAVMILHPARHLKFNYTSAIVPVKINTKALIQYKDDILPV